MVRSRSRRVDGTFSRRLLWQRCFTRKNQPDIEIPGKLILKAVAWYVARSRISAIEEMSEEDLLGIPKREKKGGG